LTVCQESTPPCQLNPLLFNGHLQTALVPCFSSPLARFYIRRDLTSWIGNTFHNSSWKQLLIRKIKVDYLKKRRTPNKLQAQAVREWRSSFRRFLCCRFCRPRHPYRNWWYSPSPDNLFHRRGIREYWLIRQSSNASNSSWTLWWLLWNLPEACISTTYWRNRGQAMGSLCC